MRYTWLAALLLASLFGPVAVFAGAGMDSQDISVVIGADFKATGAWRIPFVIDQYDPYLYAPEFDAYGSALSTKYTLNDIQDYAKSSISFIRTGEQYVKFVPGKGNAMRTYTLSYTLTPLFTQSAVLYEFWIPGGSSRQDPSLKITYPSDWKVLSLWPPEAKVSGNTITLSYPASYEEALPVMVAFQTNKGGVIQDVGKYAISGSASDVQMISAALTKLPNIDELMTKTMGIKPPTKVLIVCDDLTKVGAVGYEADALAANPNVIVFNNKSLGGKTPEEIAEIISHELAHLAVINQWPFEGRSYAVPFLHEGLAVYFEGAAHREIYSDTAKRIIAEDLNRTHIASPSEAEVLYESPFDFNFDGSRNLGVFASYMQSGLVFARFADAVGAKGFSGLFKSLHETNLQGDTEKDSKSIITILEHGSGLTEGQLETPGKPVGDTPGIVAKISHPENDPTVSSNLITNYIKNDIRHYFSGSSAPQLSVTPTIVQPQTATSTTPASAVSGHLTRTLTVGSSGAEVVVLQNFLESRGFLKMTTAKGYFGASTKNALKAYQNSVQLSSTGTTGPKTRASINAQLAK